MTELHIRDARADDHDAIQDVTLSAYQEYAVSMQAHWEVTGKAYWRRSQMLSPPNKS